MRKRLVAAVLGGVALALCSVQIAAAQAQGFPSHPVKIVVGPSPDIFNYMGFASRKLGRYDDALRFYGLALEINPQHLGANEYLGELYLQMGRRDDARRQLALPDRLCPYGCAQGEELAHWMLASATPSP